MVFELTYRIFCMAVLVKGSDIVMKICLSRLGFSYLTAENYQKFITYPLTLAFAAVGLILICLALNFEIHALFYCFEASWRRKKITVPAMICRGAEGAWHLVRKNPRRWLPYMVCASPYLGIHFLVWEMTQTKFLQFSIQQLLGVFRHYYLLAAVLAVFVCSMLFSFTIPRRVMTQDKPGEINAFWIRRLRSEWKTDLFFSALLQIFATAVVLILYLLALVIMVAWVKVTRNSQTMVSAVLVYGSLIKYSAGVVVGGVGITFTLLYLYTFFARSDQKRRREHSRGRRKNNRMRRFHSKAAAAATVLIVLLETVFLVAEARINLPNVASSQAQIAVTAHRGGAKMAPENTMSAMKYAVESLADYAEIDVQETKDGQVVLLHDTNLKRTTGLNADIWDLTYDEVSQLDAGVKFNKKFRGEQIPTLDEVIKYCRGKIKLNIEVKYNGHNKNIVKKVVKIIEDNDFYDNCVLTSMNYKFLQQAKKENPEIRTGYTLRMTYGDLSNVEDVDFFSVKHTYINRQFVEEVHRLGKEVYAWTLNYQGDMQRMIGLGVDNIITDEPELVRRVVLGETDRNPSFFTLLGYALA